MVTMTMMTMTMTTNLCPAMAVTFGILFTFLVSASAAGESSQCHFFPFHPSCRGHMSKRGGANHATQENLQPTTFIGWPVRNTKRRFEGSRSGEWRTSVVEPSTDGTSDLVLSDLSPAEANRFNVHQLLTSTAADVVHDQRATSKRSDKRRKRPQNYIGGSGTNQAPKIPCYTELANGYWLINILGCQ